MKGRLMAAEMAEQPAILEALLQRRVQIVEQVQTFGRAVGSAGYLGLMDDVTIEIHGSGF